MKLISEMKAVNILVLLALVLGATLLTGGCARRTVYVRVAPPPARQEIIPPRPAPKAVWIPGHWKWTGSGYKWVPGHWVLKPAGKAWVPGHWKKTGHGWVWIPGHWRR